MKTVQRARRSKCNRSALLRERLRRAKAWEKQERKAYVRLPEDIEAARNWETAAVWPEA